MQRGHARLDVVAAESPWMRARSRMRPRQLRGGMFKLDFPMPTTPAESQAVLDAASMLIGMGASQVFVFGSLVRGELRPDSDIDMAVSGLPCQALSFSSKQSLRHPRTARRSGGFGRRHRTGSLSSG
ncbi:MAG: nucleotidyltransferase family protein [Bryobacteraceae bacterium]